MADLILSDNYESLVDGWLKAEQNGDRFPVPFDIAWQMAGYSTKASAKRKLTKFEKGIDFSTDVLKNAQRGRSSDFITMSCDTFKHFCLLAETEQGKNIRQYFIEAEKKWKLVEKHYPEVAKEVDRIRELEMLILFEQEKQKTAEAQLRASVAELESAEAKQKYVDKCEAIKQLHGEQVLALLQGNPDAVVEKVTTITETIQLKDDRRKVSYRGISTAQLGKELGFKTGREFENYLQSIGAEEFINKGERLVEANYIKPEDIAELKRAISRRRLNSTRQLIIGERSI